MEFDQTVCLWIFLFLCLIVEHSLYALSWRSEDRFQGHEYSLSDNNRNWYSAKAACHDASAKLAVITSEEENDFLIRFVGTAEVAHRHTVNDRWIGLRQGDSVCTCEYVETSAECKACRESWTWYEGTSMGFMNWHEDEPQTGACGRLTEGARWAEYSCSQSYRFLCERHVCWDSNYCNSHGACVADKGNSANCQCDAGFTGERCEEETDECNPDPCVNGVACTDLHLDYKCMCTLGYTGKKCDTDINECENDSGLCRNGGKCLNIDGSYLCECTKYWTGTHCTEDIDECSEPDSVCPNSISCKNSLGGYTCDCLSGYSGENCDKKDGSSGPLSNVNKKDLEISLYVGLTLLIVTWIPIAILLRSEYIHRKKSQKPKVIDNPSFNSEETFDL